MFGDTISRGENLEKGLAWEIEEELGIKPTKFPLQKLNTYIKTQDLDGVDYTIHVWLIKNVPFEKLRLLEGAGFAVGTVDELLANPKLTRITRLALLDFQKTTR